jgi:hypothetical protein
MHFLNLQRVVHPIFFCHLHDLLRLTPIILSLFFSRLGRTPLHLATGDLHVAWLLIVSGADVNQQDR